MLTLDKLTKGNEAQEKEAKILMSEKTHKS